MMKKKTRSDALHKKGLEYKEYVKDHVANVEEIWERVVQLMKKEKKRPKMETRLFVEINSLIYNHDRSKFGDSEFEGYRQYFFPIKGEEKSKELFAVAWNHHMKENPHHWGYWIMWKSTGAIALEMPYKYIMEMLCDWTAMSLKFGGKPSVWFESEKDDMLLHTNTLKMVNEFLPLFDKSLE